MTDQPQTAEQTAEQLVIVAGDHVQLKHRDAELVSLARHPNPALVQEEAVALRKFLAAVIAATRAGHG